VDFLYSAYLVISQARLPTYIHYSKIDFTYKLDRTTVTVGVPSILAISTSPASAAPLLQQGLPLVLPFQ
jgi:hypothetical protein